MALQKLFVVLFVIVNLALPFVVGEVFPITTAPMFRDRPESYCDFEVRAPDGTLLDVTQFGLQRNYDGNPVGYGSGRLPADSLDRFGDDQTTDMVPHVDELREWIGHHLNGTSYPYVTVDVKVWGRVGNRIGLLDHSYQTVIPNPSEPVPQADQAPSLEPEETPESEVPESQQPESQQPESQQPESQQPENEPSDFEREKVPVAGIGFQKTGHRIT